MTIHPHKAGLALGGTLGLWHTFWALLVLLGWAQFVLDWVFRLHFITPPYTVGEFSLLLALGLIVVTSSIGYVIGWAFATIWNYVHS